MDLRKFMSIPCGRILSTVGVLLIVLCVSMLPSAVASSADSATQYNITGQLSQDNSYLLTNSYNPGNAETMVGSPSTNYYWAEVNYKDDSLSLINGTTNQVESTMKVCNHPLSVAILPGTFYAAVLGSDNTVMIVNMSTNRVFGSFYLYPTSAGGIGTISDWKGSVDRMFWRNDGRYLYVVTDNYLAVVNPWANTVVATYDITGTHAVADTSMDGSAVLLFKKMGTNTCEVKKLNTTTNNIEQSSVVHVDFDTTNLGSLRYSPDGTKAYTFIGGTNLVTIDNSTLGVQVAKNALNESGSTNRMDLEVSPDGQHLYMLYSKCERSKVSKANIITYNLNTNSQEQTFRSDARETGAIALSPDGSKIYIANYCNYWERVNTISIMNASSGEILDHITVDYGPMDIKLVPGATA